MAKKKEGDDRGVLRSETAHKNFQLTRYEPAEDVGFFVQHYWVVSWDLERPFVQEVLPFPSVNLAFEKDGARVVGVVKGRTTHHLAGRGQVVAAMFKPGGFYPFFQAPLNQLTNSYLPIEAVFGPEGPAVGLQMAGESEELRKVLLLESFLQRHLPDQDTETPLLQGIMARIVTDQELTSVDRLCSTLGMPIRTLQRLFQVHVGASPKWVIRLYRLQEAALLIEKNPGLKWADTALRLGYTDQAHFIKDFKVIFGVTPSLYLKG